MVSKDFIYSKVLSNHVIALHMRSISERIDRLCPLIYIVYELILDDKEKDLLIWNISNKIDTQGVLRIKAIRSSEVDISLEDSILKEYEINTADIVSYEVV